MAKTKISEFSSTPANNTDIDSINIAEGCAPSNINDAIRELMAQLKDFQTGAVGDSFNGPIGSSTASTGAFTNITASGTLGVTGVATLGVGAILNTPASVTLTNATGLPISTGVSGLGTGVATALAVNVGSAGAPVVNGGALGTPSSGTVTNLTGTASININGTVGATTPTTGAFTTVAASSDVTLSGGTANGVLYLNGSKVATSGSALTFDGSKLGFNGGLIADNNLVAQINSPSTTAKFFGFNRSGDYGLLIGYDNANDYASIRTVFSYPIVFSVNNTEQMRLTSTGLGIGTSSPANKLHVYTSSGVAGFQIQANAYSANYTLYAGAGGANAFGLYDNTASAYRYIVDSAGNLGLGVTPSAWSSSAKALEIGIYAGFYRNASGITAMSFNSYQNTSNNDTYRVSSNPATKYEMAGGHAWYIAPSGTAGDAISFTQAMTLNASGGLSLGVTTDPGAGSIQLGSGAYVGTGIGTGNTTGTYYGTNEVRFYTSAAERARIDSSGNFLVGRTSAIASERLSVEGSNTSFISRIRNTSATTPSGVFVSYTAAAPNDTGNSFFRADDNAATRAEIRSNGGIANYSANNVNLSDVRTKTDIQNAGGYLAKICAIPVRTFKYKDQTDDLPNLGVIAQEVEAVAPEFVDTTGFGELPEDGVPLKAIYQTDLQYALMKALQELKAEFDAYKASHP